MIIVISPAKTIDLNLNCQTSVASEAVFINDAERLVKRLKRMSAKRLAEMMHISPALAKLNFDRYKGWDLAEAEQRQAIAAFKGEVYNGLRAWDLSEKALLYAQEHLRILSGLYGVLKPLDLIKPHRLEMGTQLPTSSLYTYWGTKIVKELSQAFASEDDTLINLASNEYFKSVQTKHLKQRIVSPVFKDLKNGNYKVISVYAKKARGLMTRFIIENEMRQPQDLLSFKQDGYYYNEMLSTDDSPVFTRDHF